MDYKRQEIEESYTPRDGKHLPRKGQTCLHDARPVYARQLCRSCYNKARYGPTSNTPQKGVPCACSKPAVSKGLCRSCYNARWAKLRRELRKAGVTGAVHIDNETPTPMMCSVCGEVPVCYAGQQVPPGGRCPDCERAYKRVHQACRCGNPVGENGFLCEQCLDELEASARAKAHPEGNPEG